MDFIVNPGLTKPYFSLTMWSCPLSIVIGFRASSLDIPQERFNGSLVLSRSYKAPLNRMTTPWARGKLLSLAQGNFIATTISSIES